MVDSPSAAHPRLPLYIVWAAALAATSLGWVTGMWRGVVPSGGDIPSYLLSAQYGPLSENFDNPSHGWGFPLTIRFVADVTRATDLDRTARSIVAISAGMFVLYGGLLLRRSLPPIEAAIGVVVLGTHPAVIDLGSKAMSDMFFAALVMAVVWILFLRDEHPTKSIVLLDVVAGILAMLCSFVRGNGLALVLAAPIALIVMERGRLLRALGYLVGMGCLVLLMALLFKSQGLPIRAMFRSGAGEIAFATLDETGTWLHRKDYEEAYPNYLTLTKKIGPKLVKTAAKTIYHIHEWWLLVAFPTLGFFIIPGLLVWCRRLTKSTAAMTFCLIAVQATALWSGKFQEDRHLLAILPWLLTLAVLGVGILPRKTNSTMRWRGRSIPIRVTLLLILSLASLGQGGVTIYKRSLRPEPIALFMREAGEWLKSHSRSGDVIAATRLNIAYTAGIRPLDFVDVFGSSPPRSNEIVHALQSKGCTWLAWIRQHSVHEFPGLAWLEDASPDGARLEYDTPEIRIWSIPGLDGN